MAWYVVTDDAANNNNNKAMMYILIHQGKVKRFIKIKFLATRK